MKYNAKKVLEIYQEYPNNTIKEVTEKYCEFEGIPYHESVRKNVNKIIRKFDNISLDVVHKIEQPKKEEVISSNLSYMPSAWSPELNRFLSADEYCKKYNLPFERVKDAKLVAHNSSHMVYNILFKNHEDELVESISDEVIEEIVKKHIKPLKVAKKSITKDPEYTFDRLVYTDTHIGMNPNPNGYSLYGGKWDEQEVMKTKDIIVDQLLNEGRSNILHIDDLGDFLDGWDKQTSRGGHDLPQNMDNEKAFDVGLNFKVGMIDDLIAFYDKIVCHNICNDNHSASFGYVLNSAFKQIVEAKYPGVVEVVNVRKFMTYYTVGKNTFILSHGKDSKNLKFGFKPFLDAKQEKRIDDFIDENGLFSKDTIIEFSKGDTHLQLFDDTTASRFNYYNYPAVSPSSDWVQTNFKKGNFGFNIFSYRQDGRKTNYTYYFDWIK